jgi:hypothetical protein
MTKQKYLTLPQKLVTSYQSKLSNVQCIVKDSHKFQAHFLTFHIGTRKAYENFGMGLGQAPEVELIKT